MARSELELSFGFWAAVAVRGKQEGTSFLLQVTNLLGKPGLPAGVKKASISLCTSTAPKSS